MFPLFVTLGNHGVFSCLDDPTITHEGKLNTSARLLAFSIVADAVISITALVVGILGIVGILTGLPPAAAYTLIGLSGIISLAWIAKTVYEKADNLRDARALLLRALSLPIL